MKKNRLTAMVLAGILMVSMAGCAGEKNTAADDAAAAQGSQTETRDGTVSKILWEFAGDLAPQEGMKTNKGTAGMLSGISNGYPLSETSWRCGKTSRILSETDWRD